MLTMYLFLIFHLLYVIALGESCTTPSGQIGKCVPIRSCTSLLWSFANAKYKADEYLQKFICSNGDLGLMVCCVTSDYLVFENDEYDVDSDKVVDPRKLINAEECGFGGSPITHDGTVRLQDFPWLVKIMTEDKHNVKNVECTGVLLNNHYVLYSAQCRLSVIGDRNFFVRVDNYRGHDMNCNTSTYSSKCSDFEIYDIDASTLHPFYDPKTKINDIAILRLNRRVQFSEFMVPICLPISYGSLTTNQTLYTVGWNATYHLNDVSKKKLQSTTFISNMDCKSKLLMSGTNTSLSVYELCTQAQHKHNHKNAIGVPLMSLKSDQWYLQGFESQGENIKVYTRVQNYLQWIQEVTGEEHCQLPYDNRTGECVHLSDCPILMDAFANTSPENEKVLRKFVCWYKNEDPISQFYALKVCCGLESNFTIPLKPDEKNLENDVSDFRFCGLQHRDEYFSKDDSISIDEFPWLAVILNATLPEQKQRICGGTLITRTYILTSAQCMFQFNINDRILVRLADYHIKNSSDCVKLEKISGYNCENIEEYEIKKEIIHPFYNKYTLYNDIALLKLNKEIDYSDFIRPICLPRSEKDLASHGDILFSTGFGFNTRYGTQLKKKILASFISNEVCKVRFNTLTFVNPVIPYQICTEDIKNSSDVACVGDEGGPVMHSKRLRWFIEGISSTYGCEDNVPQTSVSVYKYLKWIKLNIED